MDTHYNTVYLYLARFWGLLFNSLFAYLADTKSLNIGNSFLVYYFVFLLVLMSNLYINKNAFLKIIDIIIEKTKQKNNLILSFIRYIPIVFFDSIKQTIFLPSFIWKLFPRIKRFIYSEKIDKLLKFRIIIFSVTYIGFFACWPVVSILISVFPDKPAFIISLSTFFTLASTVYQTIYFDPVVSLYKDYETIN